MKTCGPTVRSFVFAIATFALAFVHTPADAQQSVPDTDWRHFANDHRSSKYSPLGQIDAENFEDLKIVWRWESADKALEGKSPLEPFYFRATPIVVDGVAYLSTSLSQIAAVDLVSGETLWVHDPRSYERGPVVHGMVQHRGVEYWTDGKEERILISTGGRQLVSVDAKTGIPDPNFNDGQPIDLLQDLGRPVRPGSIGDNKPPIVVGDTVIVGSIIMDYPMIKEAPPGHIRAYDVRTGAFKWRFNSIPQKGEFGYDTWENGSAEYTGNTNAWPPMTADDELGYVYLPFGSATSDYYGGHRPGDGLFSDSLVCLNAKTGERVWHFQAVHHDIWDYDFPCAPNLIDITVDGKTIKAVAQASKQGFLYVFDRVTGKPVWPIEERKVNWHSTVPGEQLSHTQPFPTNPPPFERQGISESDLCDFTPEIHEEAKKIASDYVLGPMFSPNIIMGENGKKGLIQLPGPGGGANVSGASVDPETGWLYLQSQTAPMSSALLQPDPNRSNLRYIFALYDVDLPSGPHGLPLVKPPYRRMTAYNLNTGEIAWQIPFGDGPRNNPAIKHLELGPLGTLAVDRRIAEGGILLTKKLLITINADVDDT